MRAPTDNANAVTVENAPQRLRRLIEAQAEAWGCKVEFHERRDGKEPNALAPSATLYREGWGGETKGATPGFSIRLHATAILAPEYPGSKNTSVDELTMTATVCAYYGAKDRPGVDSHEWLRLPNDRVQAWSRWDGLPADAADRLLTDDFADRAEKAGRRALENRARLVGSIERIDKLLESQTGWVADGANAAALSIPGPNATGAARISAWNGNGDTVAMHVNLSLDDALAVLAVLRGINDRSLTTRRAEARDSGPDSAEHLGQT